ncbi:MAG: hypothetical protein D6784_06210 [Chloroflexi bacterium]|nr:MAG: hypothetical protein D6784_06210 [Chloroflexota bacterium]
MVGPTLEQIRRVKARYEQSLLQRPNVVGVGIGFKMEHNRPTDTLALVVNVKQKLPAAELSPDDILPTELEGVPVDVQEVGTIRAI